MGAREQAREHSLVTSLSRKKSTSMRMRFPLGLLRPRRLARASSARGSWRLKSLEERHTGREGPRLTQQQTVRSREGWMEVDRPR